MALHSFQEGPQVYPVCFQANLKGSGKAVPKDTAKFPAAYDINPMFQKFNMWQDDLSTFVPPGPPVYDAGWGGYGGKVFVGTLGVSRYLMWYAMTVMLRATRESRDDLSLI